MGLMQSCAAPPQNANPYSNFQGSTSIGETASGGGPAGLANPYGSGSGASTNTANDSTPIDTTGYTPDQGESQALTQYLTQHKLPLVGAQVLQGPGGGRAVVLYGFAGSDFGRSDAAAKARRYIGDSSIAVDNRIKVRPELLSSSGGYAPPSSSSPSDSQPQVDNSQYPGAQSYVDQQNQARNQYQQQQIPAGMWDPLESTCRHASLSIL